jgi:AcrR family transcriptional regulator
MTAGRWKADAEGRFVAAALVLFTEKGFDRTTVADIASAAGLTPRTFFRYFADKRDVLFAGQRAFEDFVGDSIAAATDVADPMQVVKEALAAVARNFPDYLENHRIRRRLIEANAELRERELTKLATVALVMSRGLQARGVNAGAARLAADIGMLVFKTAFDQWIDRTGPADFAALIRSGFDTVRRLTQPDPGARRA